MTLAWDVELANKNHPDWSSDRIAEFLGAHPSSVRWVGGYKGLTFAAKNKSPMKRQFRKVRYAGYESGEGWGKT